MTGRTNTPDRLWSIGSATSQHLTDDTQALSAQQLNMFDSRPDASDHRSIHTDSPHNYVTEKHMSTLEKSIEVNVPVRTANNQWTQFEEFPRFMEGVKEVIQLDDTRLHWKAEIAGQEKEWDAEIIEQTPDQRIAWTSRGGAINGGVVSFHRLSDATSKVMLQLEYDPQGVVENVGDALGVVSLRVQGDLKRFKEFIETRGCETGAWRGKV